MSDVIINEVVAQMRNMPDDLQQRVLQFTQQLKSTVEQGVPGQTLRQFSGLIPADDLEIMEQAIAEDCERVNLNEW